ncbi:MAG: twin-arginine translocase TatA/TatE family subunit [Anaerolineae bacterium]|nr:twin-arginine translocase TatA/TatE family subunit [Anaerolineae bacterium]
MNFFNIGPMELLLILVIVLMVFGPDKIPEVGASLGKAIRKFRQATKELAEEFDLEEINPTTLANVLEAQADALDRAQQAQTAGTAAPAPDESAQAPAPSETSEEPAAGSETADTPPAVPAPDAPGPEAPPIVHPPEDNEGRI